MDLYWFHPADVDASADRLWTRYAPIYRGTAGYKGVALSIGLTANFVFDLNGDPDQPIVLPDTRGQEIGNSIGAS